MCEDYASQLGCASASALRWKYNPQTRLPLPRLPRVAKHCGQGGTSGQVTQISQIKKDIPIGLRPHFFPQTTLGNSPCIIVCTYSVVTTPYGIGGTVIPRSG